jgi:hypothetical protein
VPLPEVGLEVYAPPPPEPPEPTPVKLPVPPYPPPIAVKEKPVEFAPFAAIHPEPEVPAVPPAPITKE